MSLFKARNWWSTELASEIEESFDHNSLLIARLKENQHDSVLVGSHSGKFRVFRPSSERQQDGSITGYKPIDLILEIQLAHPVLGIGVGKLVSGSQSMHIAVLHPKQLVVYSVITKEGIAEHGEQNQLAAAYVHALKHSSHSILIGPFGAVQGRDFTCIQALDGTLSFFEQESFAFSCTLNNILIPGPLAYVTRTDSFVSVTSSWQIESYRYQSLSESANGKKLTPNWLFNCGEYALDINALPLTSTETVIVVLGERNLYAISDLGKLKFMKKLDFTPLCLHCYVIGWYWEPNAVLMILIASDAGTLLIYENTTLRWSAQLPFLTIALTRANISGLSGCLVSLSEIGQLQCSYLGTEPELFSAPPLSLKPLNYDEAKNELENLHAVIKANSNTADIEFIKETTERELSFSITVNPSLQQCSYSTEINATSVTNDEPNKLLMCQTTIKLKPATGIDQLQILISVQKPLKSSEVSKLFYNLKEELACDVFIYLNDDHVVSSLQMEVVVSFINSQGAPRLLQKCVDLPLNLAVQLCAPSKDAEYKVTLNTSHPPASLAQLFPDFPSDSLNPSALGFSFLHRLEYFVTVVTAKSSPRYRLQSDHVHSLCLLTKVLANRLKHHFKHTESYKVICESSLPIPQLLQEIEEHFNYRMDYKVLDSKLAQLTGQYRLVQRRLLVKLKDKVPTPLEKLEGLLNTTIAQIFETMHRIESINKDLARSHCRLNAVLNLVKTLFELMNLPEVLLRNVQSALITPVSDLDDQSWEELTDVVITYLLRTSLSSKTNQETHNVQIQNPTPPVLTDCIKFKKHLALFLDRVSKEVQVDKEDNKNTDNDVMEDVIGLPDVEEEIVLDTEFNIPEGLRLGERKIEIFKSKPLLEGRKQKQEEID